MGKRNAVQNMQPFCYYCDRDFADEKVLIQHQRSKHFKCPECSKRLNTATALSLHFLSVHKRELTVVPYSLQDRCKTDLEIHGLEGVPFALIEKRAKERGLELPVGYVEPSKPAPKKKKIMQSPYAQYYSQYYQYPSVNSTHVSESSTPVTESLNTPAPEEVSSIDNLDKVKKDFPLESISYDLPELNESVILIMSTPNNIYEDVKYRAYMSNRINK
eukprot:NODE_113_length_19319_cov_0.247815.p9 type:complete len:217 gc:universal NODE_113_length_19319_cov_0.247815:11855-12505(+)